MNHLEILISTHKLVARLLTSRNINHIDSLPNMQTTKRFILIFISFVLFILLFKAFLHPNFLAVPPQYRNDLSEQEKKAAFDYLQEYERPPVADDVVVPDADAAIKLAYGGS